MGAMFSLAGFARAMASEAVPIGGCSVVLSGLSARDVAAVENAVGAIYDAAAVRKGAGAGAAGPSRSRADHNLTLMAARVAVAGKMCDAQVNGGKPWATGDSPEALGELAERLLGLVTAQELQDAFVRLVGLEAGPTTLGARKARDRAAAAAIIGQMLDDPLFAAGQSPLAQAAEAICRDAAQEHASSPQEAARAATHRLLRHLRAALEDTSGAALGREQQLGLVGN
jgi:hypothetical protein